MLERLINVLRGIFARFVSGVEQANPEALLEVEKENLRKQIGSFNEGLVSHAALCERLIQQVKKLAEEEQQLRARTRAHLRAGNRAQAADCALRLQTVARELEENRVQAEEAETTYKDLVKARDGALEAARERIEKLRRGIDEMRIHQAMADLNQMAAGLVTQMGGAGDTLARLEQMVEEQRARAVGVSRVARDVVEKSDADVLAERDVLADEALADFAAREGIDLSVEAPLEKPEVEVEEIKRMGPPYAETE